MLTSFFGKSKPTNFIIVSIYIIIGYFFWIVIAPNATINLQEFPKQLLILVACLFTVFLLNFIVKKNSLTENNTYSILFFACFMLMMPAFFDNPDIIISNLFLLLAIRRILSFPSEKNMEKKILDASIWIAMASLFCFLGILYFIVLFAAIFQRRSKNYKLILIPFVGFSTTFVLLTVYHLLLNNYFSWFLDIDTSLSLDFTTYNSQLLIVPILFLSILLVWALIQKTSQLSKIRLKEKSSYFLLILIQLISVILIALIPNKNGSELLFIMAPLAIFSANLIEKLHIFWVKEVILWVVVMLPILVVFL